jgi:L-ascorbate metabolism protein UlaG (beta-lactamase superfamily)
VELTRFGHSCVRLDSAGRTLVIDPGVFSDVAASLDGADAVLITHEHPDHIAAEPVRAALAGDSRLRLWSPASVAAGFADLGEQVVTVAAGQSLDVAGFAVRTFGGQHALIHSSIPVVANIAYLVAETVYHPGDSFAVPPVPVPVLLVPTIAPWSKAAEVIDFTVAVRPTAAFPIHDAIANDLYANLVEGHLARITAPYGVSYRHLPVGETAAV